MCYSNVSPQLAAIAVVVEQPAAGCFRRHCLFLTEVRAEDGLVPGVHNVPDLLEATDFAVVKEDTVERHSCISRSALDRRPANERVNV